MKEFIWQLNSIYHGFEDENYHKDIAYVESEWKELTEQGYGKIDSAEEFEKLLQRLSLVMSICGQLYDYASLCNYISVSDKEAERQKEECLERKGKLELSVNEILDAFVWDPRLTKWMDECDDLRQYRFFFQKKKEESRHRLTIQQEDQLQKKQREGGYYWQSYRDRLDGKAVYQKEDGTVLSLTQLRNCAFHADESVRRSGWECEMQVYEGYKEEMAKCLVAIKKEGIEIAHIRKYDSVLDWMLNISSMSRKTLESMLAEVETFLPEFWKYLKKKAELLSHENGLPYYELSAPVGNAPEGYSLENQKKLIDIFYGVNKNIGAFFEAAFKNHWIDAVPRPGKVGGALCAQFPLRNECRVFMNATGGVEDMITVAHELGHGFHGQAMEKIPYLLWDVPTPICETASTFNETCFYEYLIRNTEKENKRYVLDLSLGNAVKNIVDMVSRFRFEDDIFRLCETQKNITAEQIQECMVKSQKFAYGDGADESLLHPFMWMCKPHYYIPNFHYYNFPYMFGTLLSKGIYMVMQKEKEQFFPMYERFLQNSATMSVEKAVESLGISVEKRDFWEMALSYYKRQIEEFINC